MIRVAEIRTDGGTQSRAAISDDTIAEYAEAMADPDTVFPPVVVYYDGSEYWLADGFHRVAAWRKIGREEIPAEVRQGDRRQAVLHSCLANSTHGLRRTNADKRRAVTTLLDDDEWSKWPDNEIARRCGVSQPFVSKVRGELSYNGYKMPEARTVERGGTVYQQNTSNIGKPETAAEPVEKPTEAIAATVTAPDPAPDPYGFTKLTFDGLVDEATGLRDECEELRKRVKKQTSQIADLKLQIKQLSETDQGRVISQLHGQLATVKLKRDDAMMAAKRMEYRMKKAEDERDSARSEQVINL